MRSITTNLENLLGKQIVITEPTNRLFSDMLGLVSLVTKSPQSESVFVKSGQYNKLLHWETKVTCVVVDPEKDPEYFL
jgi:hypothetical protein